MTLVVLKSAFISRTVTEVENTLSVLLTINLVARILPTIVAESWSVAEDVFDTECGKAIRMAWVEVLLFNDGKEGLIILFRDWREGLRR